MKTTEKREELIRALDYVDPAMIAGAVRKIDEKKSRVRVTRKKTGAVLKVAAALAACLVLLAVALPTATVITEYHEYFPLIFGAGNSGENTETTPEYDGSRGLLYEVSEDGTEAFCVGWGSCTDEVVYIASHYNGLPVTSVYNKGYLEASVITADHPFKNKYVKKLVISDTVVYVASEFIRQCPNIESIYFGASVEYISTFPWPVGHGENFATVEVSPDNPNYSSKGNCLVDLRTRELVIATPTTVIPDDGSVVIIGMWSFSSAEHGLTSIVIPEGVKIIADRAFSGCLKLESIKLPDSLEFIEGSAFASCYSLKTIELGRNLRSVNQTAFQDYYPPTLYYKGTVAEWDAINKTLNSNVSKPVTVICTDGETLSTSGNQEDLWWQRLPEYEEIGEVYNKLHFTKKYAKYTPHASSGEKNIEITRAPNE